MPKQANFASLDGLHTFPRLLFHHAKTRPNAPAMREKYLGIWQTWTWSDVAERVRALACGLAALGFKRGENLAVIGDNRPHLYMMMTAAQCLGGVPVPLYQDAVANEMLFALQDAGIRFRPARWNTSFTTTRAACATTTSLSCTTSMS